MLVNILASRRWLIDNRMTYADFRAATIMPFAREGKAPVDAYRNILGWAARLEAIYAWRTPFEGLI